MDAAINIEHNFLSPLNFYLYYSTWLVICQTVILHKLDISGSCNFFCIFRNFLLDKLIDVWYNISESVDRGRCPSTKKVRLDSRTN
jgi:hypothetical protein